MRKTGRHPLIAGAGITSLGTLASRVLGLLRDMSTAPLLGMSGGGVMDAFVVAFRIPNLFRRLFGEGALTASYVPVLAARLEEDPRQAWQLTSVLLAWLAVVLTGIVLAAELVCLLAWTAASDQPRLRLLAGLTAVMMPYMLFICLAAEVAATLQCLGHFSIPALAPTLLNLCWLAAAWWIAPRFAPDKPSQAYVLAGSILVAGVLQLAVQWPKLRRLGFHFDYHWAAARDSLAEVLRSMGPMVLGLAVTQINTLLDSVIALGLSAAPQSSLPVGWLGGAVRYPMQHGAAAAVYYGERLYEFPLGILGIAVATAIFPLLSRHAARGDQKMLAADLTLGLRLVLLLGVPASMGLVVLAAPLVRLLFERGQFTADDAARAARMVAWYGSGVWAYCALPVVIRGYYALGDRLTPLRIGMLAVGLNLSLNLTLIWPMAESGLALATASSAVFQLAALLAILSRRTLPVAWRTLAATALRALVATGVMALAGWGTLGAISLSPGGLADLIRVLAVLAVSLAVYAAAHAALGRHDIRILLGRAQGEDG